MNCDAGSIGVLVQKCIYSELNKKIMNAIQFFPDFIYFGVKFQASGLAFTKHIDKRAKAAGYLCHN